MNWVWYDSGGFWRASDYKRCIIVRVYEDYFEVWLRGYERISVSGVFDRKQVEEAFR